MGASQACLITVVDRAFGQDPRSPRRSIDPSIHKVTLKRLKRTLEDVIAKHSNQLKHNISTSNLKSTLLHHQ